jgi:hypothetical protein
MPGETTSQDGPPFVVVAEMFTVAGVPAELFIDRVCGLGKGDPG